MPYLSAQGYFEGTRVKTGEILPGPTAFAFTGYGSRRVDEDTVEQVLGYIAGRGVATHQHLVNALSLSRDDADAAANELERRGWIARGEVRFIESPGPGIVTLNITRQGRQESERLDLLASSDPEVVVELGRAELIAELKRRGLTDEQIMGLPLNAERFWFWPAMDAWAIKRGDG